MRMKYKLILKSYLKINMLKYILTKIEIGSLSLDIFAFLVS